MDYVFGRMVLAFLSLVSIGMIVVGGLMASAGTGLSANAVSSYGFGAAIPAGLAGAIPGLFISLAGLLLLAVVDHFMASFDTASSSKKLVRLAEQQVKISRQALKVGAMVVPGYGDMGFEDRERLLGNQRNARTGFLGLFSRTDVEDDDPIASSHRRQTAEPIREDQASRNGNSALVATRPSALEANSAPTARLEPSLTARSLEPDATPSAT